MGFEPFEAVASGAPKKRVEVVGLAVQAVRSWSRADNGQTAGLWVRDTTA